MRYEFALNFDIDGRRERRHFAVVATTLSNAVRRSLTETMAELPMASFVGLTYFYHDERTKTR